MTIRFNRSGQRLEENVGAARYGKLCEVLDKVYVRSLTTIDDPDRRLLDVGAIAEACLFYGTTEVVFNRGTLERMLLAYGTHAVLEFVRGGYIRAHISTDDVAIMTENSGSRDKERHMPVGIGLAGRSPEQQVADAFLAANDGRVGLSRRQSKLFLDAAPIITLGDGWKEDVIAALRDTRLLTAAIQTTARHANRLGNLGELIVTQVKETPDGFFQFALSDNWPAHSAAWSTRYPNDPLSRAHLIAPFVQVLSDLQFASRLQGDISTGPLGSELLQLKCRELARAASANQGNLSSFQSHILPARDLRSVMNSGERSLTELMELLDRARRFRTWIAKQPIDTELVSAYVQEVTSGTWAGSLPVKTLRLVAPLAASTLLPPPLGVGIGAALSAADMFLLDKVAMGWRPNQFVEDHLDPFVSGKASA